MTEIYDFGASKSKVVALPSASGTAPLKNMVLMECVACPRV